MDFHFEQRYRTAPDRVAAAYADPALYERFAGLPKLSAPEILDHRVDRDTVRLQLRYRFIGDLPSAARRMIDPAKLTWVEHSVHDLAARTATFRMDPDHYGDRFRAEGRYRFEPTPEGGTVRHSTGDVRVTVRLVGRAVERAIVSGLGEHLAAETPVVERFLTSG